MKSHPPPEQALFEQACARPTAGRGRFLAAVCGDDHDLRQRLEGLLRAHAIAGDFMAAPAAVRVEPSAAPPGERAGDVISHYRLLARIGEGGFGDVWRAEQVEPLRREVALKIIKPGMDTREVIARFEAERQALAMMDHPNIARVFDAGATASGRPYFVMELVPGVRLTDFCDASCLGMPERLRLFVQVCHGVQHAHQKGVIHRDIKPSNILVAVIDGLPVPKIIDFGIAKATARPRMAVTTGGTKASAFLGTPGYTSPEQTMPGTMDVDTRADIYSLGVVLYELLTGCLPFSRATLEDAGLENVGRLIREKMPPHLAARVQRLPDSERATIAKCRGLGPRQLIGMLRGDLDAIVQKCLEKDRARRYETTADVAADVERLLRDEPIAARPAGWWYRTRKLVQRHQLGVATAAAIAASLIVGLGLAVHEYRRALTQQRLAEAARTRAEGLVKFVMDDLQPRLQSYGRLTDLRQSAEAAIRYFDQLPESLRDTPTIRAHATALELLATIDGGWEGSFERAGSEPVRAMFRRALGLRRELLARAPDDPAAAVAVLQDENRVAFGQVSRADWEQDTREILAGLRDLERRFPATPVVQEALAWHLVDRAYIAGTHFGRIEEGIALAVEGCERWERIAAAAPEDAGLELKYAIALQARARALRYAGRFDEALPFSELSVTTVKSALARDPYNHRFLRFAGLLSTDHVYLLAEISQARVPAAAAREFYQRLIALDPTDLEWRLFDAYLRMMTGWALAADFQFAAARTQFEEARGELERMVAEPRARRMRRDAVANAGVCAARAGDVLAARAHLATVRDIFTADSGREPAGSLARLLADFEARQAQLTVAASLADWGEVERLAGVMRDDMQRGQREIPGSEFELVRRHAAANAYLGRALLRQGRVAEARTALEAARDGFDRAPPGGTFTGYPKAGRWDALDDLAEVFAVLGDRVAAQRALERSLAWRDAEFAREGGSLEFRMSLARVCWLLSRVLDREASDAPVRADALARRAADLVATAGPGVCWPDEYVELVRNCPACQSEATESPAALD